MDDPFPLPFVMTFVGYFAIMLIDRVVAAKYHVHNADDFAALTQKEGNNTDSPNIDEEKTVEKIDSKGFSKESA